MPRIELEDERGRYEAVIPEEPDTRKLRILRDWLDLGIRDYEVGGGTSRSRAAFCA